MSANKKNIGFLLKFFIIFNVSVMFLLATNTIFFKQIILKGDINKQDIVLAKPILSKYENRPLTIKQIEKLRELLNNLFKKQGKLFTEVILPPQTIKNNVLVLVVVRAKIGSISVYGNKYYSTKFIKNNLNLKKGDYLNYKTLMKSLLLLNDYQDLKIKAYLKKGKKFGETELNLDVNDSKPFHCIITYDNSGSKNTSKGRISADIFYGNLLTDGDDINLHTTFGSKHWSTKLYKALYNTKPFGKYHTKFNIAYLYANYIATGTLSVLNVNGDTKALMVGVTQPLLYTSIDKVNMMLSFNRQNSRSYLLGKLSSENKIKTVVLSTSWYHSNIFYGSSIVFSVSKGCGGNENSGSRFKESKEFIKYNINTTFNLYSNNLKNNLLLTFKGQYTTYRLPLSEMFSIGGVSSVRGYSSSVQLGDTGYTTSFEWFYHPQIKNQYFKNGIQLGLFIDDGMAYVHNPIPGETKSLNLVGGGGEVIMNIKKRFSTKVGIGFPLHSSREVESDNKIIYMIFNAKLW